MFAGRQITPAVTLHQKFTFDFYRHAPPPHPATAGQDPPSVRRAHYPAPLLKISG
jgi:hypothetical protein